MTAATLDAKTAFIATKYRKGLHKYLTAEPIDDLDLYRKNAAASAPI